jgi:hypothetical protein
MRSPKTDAWIEMSGAKDHELFPHVERAELARFTGDEATRHHELREAHQLLTEMGAPLRTEQVAKELGACPTALLSVGGGDASAWARVA